MEQQEFPLIIAMKDDLESNNAIAHELAAFLKCPLINQSDISQALQNSTKIQLPKELTNNLPFEAICQIALTQLRLKINVIVNFALSYSAHLDKLVQLASLGNAELIIIECETKHNNTDDIGHIQKLKVDKKAFEVKKIISDMSILLSEKKKNEAIAAREAEKLKNKKNKQPSNDHLHALILLEKARKDKLACNSCSKVSSGPCYQCVECDEFILHKSCAESAPNIENIPSFLRAIRPDEYGFQSKHKCINCEDFSDDCYDCLLQTHLNHGFLPTICFRKQHQHPLNFIIMPFRYNYQYQCCICDELGSSISYKCFDCNYDVHVSCILPSTIKMRNGQVSFILKSKSPLPDEAPTANYHCNICNGEIEWRQLFYGCKDRDPNIHLKCMPDARELLKKHFMQFSNKDGVLDEKNITKAMASLGSMWPKWRARRAMQLADVNRDGVISQAELDELANYALKLGYVV